MNEANYIKQAKDMASIVRERMFLGYESVAELFHVIEDMGLAVVRRDMEKDGPDGIYANNGDIAVAIINRAKPRNRQRFTAAHELGHYMFDNDTGLQVDEDISNPGAIREKRANAFAAYFLMPEAGIRNLLAQQKRKSKIEPEDVIHLSHHFGVSVQAVIFHLVNTEFIGTSEKNRFLKMQEEGSLKAIEVESGYLRQKRSKEEEFPILPSDYVKRAINAYTAGKLSLMRLSELLEWSDVEALKCELDNASIVPQETPHDYRVDVELA